VALLLVRLHVAQGLGFGDAEALYASYGLHPQPAYLDHPGLIGLLARWLADSNVAASPFATHVFTAVVATIVPWLGGVAARAAAASWAQALRTVIALALVPELSIGLFAFSPDLPLSVLWLTAIATAALALRRERKRFETLLLTLATGALVGLACLAKASALLLALALVVTWLGRGLRSRWLTAAPWAAVAVAGILVVPVVIWEMRTGAPMLQHRLISTQLEAGFSLRNVGALFGGQLVYITPLFLLAAVYVGRDLFRRRNDDPISRLLWWCAALPGAVLLILCLWSKVAEPHWLAPAYLALAVHAARTEVVTPRLKTSAAITGALIAALAWAWIKTPLPLRLLGTHYRPRYDLANDLYAWGPARTLLTESVRQAMVDSQQLPVVIGPHWIVCAQAQATLGQMVPVGCNSPHRDDFDTWLPRSKWAEAKVLLFVTDDRFTADESRDFPDRTLAGVSHVNVMRDGRIVRTVRVSRLLKMADVALRDQNVGPLAKTNVDD
jgi:hypothetical protein